MSNGLCADPMEIGCQNPVREPAIGSGRLYSYCTSCSSKFGARYRTRPNGVCEHCDRVGQIRGGRCAWCIVDINGQPVDPRIRWWMMKESIFEEEGRVCVYCDEEAATVDHVRPKARKLGGYGTDDPSNLVPACKGCNYEAAGNKGSKTLLEWELIEPEKVQHGLRCSVKVRAEYDRLKGLVMV